MIKAIVFDLGGVIFESDGGSFEAREKMARKFRLESSGLHEYWSEKKKDIITGKMSEDEYVRGLIGRFNLKIRSSEIKQFIRQLNKINEEMVGLLKSLKNNYQLAVLNNEVREWNDYRIKKFNLKDYFGLIVSSCDVGLAKPEIEIYKILLRLLKVPPRDVFFIDNRKENLVPAEELGINTIHFTTKEDLKKLEEKNILVN